MTKQNKKTPKNKKSAPTKSKKKKKEMTQRVKIPAAKPDYQSSILGTHVLDSGLCKLPSDLDMHIVTGMYMYTSVLMYTNKISVKNKK